MNILLNLIVIVLSTIWLYKKLTANDRQLILPIAALFLLGSFIAFMVSMFILNDFLDGIIYIVNGCVSSLIFWLMSTILIIWIHQKNNRQKNIVGDLAQTIVLLILPIFILLWFSTLTFKIGG